MSVTAISVVAVIGIIALVAFYLGTVFGYGVRVSEEQNKYKNCHGHTSHKGCAIFSPYIKKGGIR